MIWCLKPRQILFINFLTFRDNYIDIYRNQAEKLIHETHYHLRDQTLAELKTECGGQIELKRL